MHVVTVKTEDTFQALADPTRIRIMRLLVDSGEVTCQRALVDSLQEPQHKLSRHLKTLRQAGLLTAVRDGRWLFLRLVTATPTLTHVHSLVRSIPDADGMFAADLARFRDRMCLRDVGDHSGRARSSLQTN